MARPLPVNMLLAGTGAVLLVSGVGGESIADVLKGSFGNLEVKNPNIGGGEVGAGQEQASLTGGSSFSASPVSFSQSTIAPPANVQRGAGAPSEALFQARKRELEQHFGRKLTGKEITELRDLERKHEL